MALGSNLGSCLQDPRPPNPVCFQGASSFFGCSQRGETSQDEFGWEDPKPKPKKEGTERSLPCKVCVTAKKSGQAVC